MSLAQILSFIQIGKALVSAGVDIAGKFKALLSDAGLTEDQINQIEAAAMADDDMRIARRIAEAGDTTP